LAAIGATLLKEVEWDVLNPQSGQFRQHVQAVGARRLPMEIRTDLRRYLCDFSTEEKSKYRKFVAFDRIPMGF
jgi:hypothetical protein